MNKIRFHRDFNILAYVSSTRDILTRTYILVHIIMKVGKTFSCISRYYFLRMITDSNLFGTSIIHVYLFDVVIKNYQDFFLDKSIWNKSIVTMYELDITMGYISWWIYCINLKIISKMIRLLTSYGWKWNLQETSINHLRAISSKNATIS